MGNSTSRRPSCRCKNPALGHDCKSSAVVIGVRACGFMNERQWSTGDAEIYKERARFALVARHFPALSRLSEKQSSLCSRRSEQQSTEGGAQQGEGRAAGIRMIRSAPTERSPQKTAGIVQGQDGLGLWGPVRDLSVGPKIPGGGPVRSYLLRP